MKLQLQQIEKINPLILYSWLKGIKGKILQQNEKRIIFHYNLQRFSM